MNEQPPTPSPSRRPCVHAWCVTEHGATVHPDDEVHRSAGLSFTARARAGGVQDAGRDTDVEIGALRRVDDAETWVVIETGIGVSLEVSRDGADQLWRRLRDHLRPGGILPAEG